VQYEKLQHMIEVLEVEARKSGFEYSADFLRIAASSLAREAFLSEKSSAEGKTSLENHAVVH